MLNESDSMQYSVSGLPLNAFDSPMHCITYAGSLFLLIFLWMCDNWMIYSPIDGCLGCFQCADIMNKATAIVRVQACRGHFVYYLG